MEYSDDTASHLHSLSMKVTGNKNEIYNKWADTYDNYVKSFEYCGPLELVKLIKMHHFFDNKSEISILDFGCGTGLLGEEFNSNHLDNCKLNMTGVDISENMISKCSERNVYNNLVCRDILKDESEKDILDKLNVKEEFDLLISCGVFLEGHVSLWEVNKILINLVKEQGGIIAFTVRNSFLQESPKFFMSLFDNSRIRIIAKVKIAYLKGVDAWAIILKRV